MLQKRGVSPVATTIITLAVLVLVMLFFWRVFVDYRQIRAGGVVTLPQFTTQTSFSSAYGTSSSPASGTVDVAAVDDRSIGPKGAALTIVEFLDYQCPYCQAVEDAVRSMETKYGDRVRFIVRDFPLQDLHPDAVYAAEAAGCAEAQGKYWPMHDRLFALKGQLTQPDLEQAAEQSGADINTFKSCMGRHDRLPKIQADVSAGAAAGVRGTPTFFFNGKRVEGVIPPDVFDQLIQGFLKG